MTVRGAEPSDLSYNINMLIYLRVYIENYSGTLVTLNLIITVLTDDTNLFNVRISVVFLSDLYSSLF